MSHDGSATRDPKSGRFNRGHSGNKNGRPKKRAYDDVLPHDLALTVLKAGAVVVDVKDQDGETQRLPVFEVVLRQLAIAAVKGDKSAAKAFINYTAAAARITEVRMQQRSERLGAYLKSIDEGTPWRLEEAEAAFYQELADEAGFPIEVKPHNAADEEAALDSADIDAIVANPKVWKAVRNHSLDFRTKRELIRRIIYAHWRTGGRAPAS